MTNKQPWPTWVAKINDLDIIMLALYEVLQSLPNPEESDYICEELRRRITARLSQIEA